MRSELKRTMWISLLILLTGASDINSALDLFFSPECVVCWEKVPQILFEPCKHVCVCSKCRKDLSLCPMCREKFTKKKGLTKKAVQMQLEKLEVSQLLNSLRFPRFTKYDGAWVDSKLNEMDNWKARHKPFMKGTVEEFQKYLEEKIENRKEDILALHKAVLELVQRVKHSRNEDKIVVEIYEFLRNEMFEQYRTTKEVLRVDETHLRMFKAEDGSNFMFMDQTYVGEKKYFFHTKRQGVIESLELSQREFDMIPWEKAYDQKYQIKELL